MQKSKLSEIFFRLTPNMMSLFRTEVRSNRGSLTVPQFRVLAHISRGFGHVADIASLHGVSQPAMSKLVTNLVDKGLVLREHDSEDRRVINLFLTKEGSRLFKSIKLGGQRSFLKRLEKLSEDEINTLYRSCVEVEKIIEKLKG